MMMIDAHQLLQQQLKRLELDSDSPPNQEQWRRFQKTISESYHHNDASLKHWQDSYGSLREELTDSYEDLRRSSAYLLRSERDKLQAVIESLGEGLCSLNENGCLLFMNPKATELVGWDGMELRGQLILDRMIAPIEGEPATKKLFSVIQQGETYRVESGVFFHRQGHEVPVSYILTPVMREGTFQGAVLSFRNISAFLKAQAEREQKLRETLLLNRVIGVTSSSLDFTNVLNSICKELARYFNLPQAAFGLLNEERDHLKIIAEYYGKGRIPALGEVIPVKNNPATQTVLKTKMPLYIPDAQTDPRQAVIQNISRRRGTRSLLIVPLLVRGEVLGTLGLNATEYREFDKDEIKLVQNVASAVSHVVENAKLYTAVQQELAERRAAEMALAQARDKALEASRLKSELIAKVSHELRTPLTAIMGFAEMIQLGIYGNVNPAQIEILEKILKSTDGLVTLVNDLLDVAQLEAGRMTLHESPFAPEELINRVELTMRVLAEKKGLTLSSSIDPTLPPHLIGDEERLYQVLLNLVSNAVKFTKTGSIRIRAQLDGNDQWLLEVTDTGIGIPDEMQSLIFDQFQQVRFGPTRENGGVGLGLSIVKQLASLMSGRIVVESIPEQGSTFRLILPLQIPEIVQIEKEALL